MNPIPFHKETLMSIGLFLFSLAFAAVLVVAALVYLRATTRRVLLELCGSEPGADFWLRSSDLMALTGTLLLVLAFGDVGPSHDLVFQLRLVTGLALAGLFVTVLIVASSVWRNVPERTAPEAAAEAV
jgi:hypothetical protein